MTSMVLLELSDQGFFVTLSQLGTSQLVEGCVLLVIIFVVVVFYAGALYFFTALMWSLDEISSLFLAAKMQASVRA